MFCLQVSTYQASSIEQRAIFDTSPKLKEINAEGANKQEAIKDE